jgi:hypothetical protein
MQNSQQTLSPQTVQACQPLVSKPSTARHPPEPPVPALEEEHRFQSAYVRSKVKRGQAKGKNRKGAIRCKLFGLLSVVMLSILGIVQGLSDCQIMEDWLPAMFDGAGTACCIQSGITCNGCTLIDGEIICNSGRITKM